MIATTRPASPVPEQLRFTAAPMVEVRAVDRAGGNRLLVEWGHRLGPVDRPFAQEGYVLEMDGSPIAVAVSASTVSATVAGFSRREVVELSRLCARPDASWASRVMLRLWREVCAPRWACWPVLAAVSYSHNAHHRGDLYRFDGWRKTQADCGSGGGGTWSKARGADAPVSGSKSLWVWEYAR